MQECWDGEMGTLKRDSQGCAREKLLQSWLSCFRVTPVGQGRAPSWGIRAVAITSGVMCLPTRQDSCVPATLVTASGLPKSLVLVPEGARSVSAEGVYLSVLGKHSGHFQDDSGFSGT